MDTGEALCASPVFSRERPGNTMGKTYKIPGFFGEMIKKRKFLDKEISKKMIK